PQGYPVEVMAAMRRIPVPGTPLFEKGQISAVELAKIVATIVLCMRPSRAMGVHEPTPICLIAGSNQIYAEVGINPRDCIAETKGSRGFSVADAEAMLKEASWEIAGYLNT
ncbi:MAG: radical SAM protein, partial [Niameybacter sp.]